MLSEQITDKEVRLYKHCPLCGGAELQYEFIVDKHPICRCRGCNLMFINPQPQIPTHIRDDSLSEDYRSNGDSAENHKRNAASYLNRLTDYSHDRLRRLLVVGDDCSHLVDEANRRGLNVDWVTLNGFSSNLPGSEKTAPYDACILISVLEKHIAPEKALHKIKDLLTVNGSLMVIYPSTDSWSARLFGPKWWEFRKENLFYFDITTMQNLLLKVGYEDPLIYHDYRSVSLNYAKMKLRSMRKGFVRRALSALLFFAPGIISDWSFPFWDTRKIVISRPKRSEADLQVKLSVIVPVFNEKNTFSQLMDALLSKEIPDVEIEVIIVESNSTDGSREDVLKYQAHPRVKVLLEDLPMGKGHAVRTGMKHATGDIILIQDADLE
ncbi:MAG: glycosyltransferase, partial [Syntrophaceae bacterium]